MPAKQSSKSGCFGAVLVLAVFGLLTRACDGSDNTSATALTDAPAVRFTRPVHVTGDGINVRGAASATAAVLSAVSSTDSVDYLERLNGQWSKVKLRDGTEGYVSNKYLEGISYTAPPAPARTKKVRPRRSAPRPQPVALAYYCNSGNTVKYHASEYCRGLNRCGASVVSISLREAQQQMDPCKFCY